MIRHKGLYYLTYSGSHCLSDYGSGYAVSDSPLGHYEKYGNNPILRSNDKVHGVEMCIRDSLPTKNDISVLFFTH